MEEKEFREYQKKVAFDVLPGIVLCQNDTTTQFSVWLDWSLNQKLSAFGSKELSILQKFISLQDLHYKVYQLEGYDISEVSPLSLWSIGVRFPCELETIEEHVNRKRTYLEKELVTLKSC